MSGYNGFIDVHYNNARLFSYYPLWTKACSLQINQNNNNFIKKKINKKFNFIKKLIINVDKETFWKNNFVEGVKATTIWKWTNFLKNFRNFKNNKIKNALKNVSTMLY